MRAADKLPEREALHLSLVLDGLRSAPECAFDPALALATAAARQPTRVRGPVPEAVGTADLRRQEGGGRLRAGDALSGRSLPGAHDLGPEQRDRRRGGSLAHVPALQAVRTRRRVEWVQALCAQPLERAAVGQRRRLQGQRLEGCRAAAEPTRAGRYRRRSGQVLLPPSDLHILLSAHPHVKHLILCCLFSVCCSFSLRSNQFYLL